MFDEVNRLSANGIAEFRIGSFDGSQLLVIGSFDLSYYHDVELTFTEVEFIRCPTYFCEPHFRDAGKMGDGRQFEIKTDEGLFEIIAECVSVVIGKVYHYDRGEELKDGERIADWVKRGNAEPSVAPDCGGIT
jgi:hypothetical protein